MQRFLVFILLLSFSNKLFSQNLVPNPSFESYSSIPTSPSNFYADDWTQIIFSGGSSDYLHTSGYTATNHGDPGPASGNGYVGVITVDSAYDYGEYIDTELTSPLITGNSYFVSFAISIGTLPQLHPRSNNLGLVFSHSQLYQNQLYQIITEPHINIEDSITNEDWRNFNFLYTADSNYNHISLGRFIHDSLTYFTPGSFYFYSGNELCYRFIDDVAVTPFGHGLDILGDTAICLGDSVLLTAIQDSAFLCNWSDNTISDSANFAFSTNSVWVHPAQSTTYFAKSKYFADSIRIEVFDSTINIFPDTIKACQGEIIDNNYLTNFIYNNYQIEDLSFNLVNIPGTSGQLDVTSTLINGGCATNNSTYLYFEDLPTVDLGNDTINCTNYLRVELIVNDTTVVYSWMGDTAYNNNDYYGVWGGGPVEVTVIVKDSIGCLGYDTVYVEYSRPDKVYLGQDKIFCLDSLNELDAFYPGATYLWQDGSTNSYYVPLDSGTYSVTVTTDSGCVSSDEVFVDFMDCEVDFIIPNVFTPNGDGFNDFLTPTKLKGYSKYEFSIYNRWGTKVYFTKNSINWNGTYKNNALTDGVYFYTMELRDIFGKYHFYKGSVSLLR